VKSLDIGEFETQLRELMGAPFPDRPFVCEGSPLDCQVFIVGINAASSMKDDFWDFWRPGYGFDRAAWLDAYLATRTKPSRTRKAMQIIMDQAMAEHSEVRFLETNIYSIPTARENMLKSHQKSTKVFDFLLASIKPQVLLVHGAEPAQYVRNLGLGESTIVIESPHFIYVGHDKAREHGREIARTIRRAN